MLTHPRLKHCYHTEFLDDENVLLASENSNALLTGERYALVLSEISRQGRSLDELAEALHGKMSELELYYTLGLLEKKGYLTEAEPALPQEASAYWNNLGIEGRQLLQALREKTVSLETLGSVKPELFVRTFESLGIRTNRHGDITLVVTDDYQRTELRSINQQALEQGQPWMLVKPNGSELWIGPIFRPEATGCWECLEHRLRMNRKINTFYRAQKQTDDILPLPAASLPLSRSVAVSLAAQEIVKWLYHEKNERLEGKLLSFDMHTLTSRSHALVKRPQCPACGTSDTPEAKPIVLKRSSPSCRSLQGGYRDVSPDETLEAYIHHVSPITGVVQRLTPYHRMKGAPVYNYASGHNLAYQSKSVFWLNAHARNSTGGKGKTWTQAKASALCEAIERYSCVYQGEEPFVVTTLRELGDKGIHPNACMNFSEKQYQQREKTNRETGKFYFMVPVPFDESQKGPWTPVYSLTAQEFKYLPTCLCYNQTPEGDEWNMFAYPDSNGGAAGNSLEEAILQGFLELVERDCVALWWYNMLRRPMVDLASFHEPYFLQLIEFYASLNRTLYVLDITSDLQIPAFVAISHRLNEKGEDIIFGCGAHVDAQIAIERALTELNLILPIVNVSEEERSQEKYGTSEKGFLDWLDSATAENQPYVVPLNDVPKKTAADYPQLCQPNVYDSLIFCIDTAAKHGLETLVLDMTRPDVGLPVAKVFVPGLRHFWKRLAPGRLYDVPVKMGWADEALQEEELNQIALFI